MRSSTEPNIMDKRTRQIAVPPLLDRRAREFQRRVPVRRSRRGVELLGRLSRRPSVSLARSPRGQVDGTANRVTGCAAISKRSKQSFPDLVDTKAAARLLVRPPETLKRWRYEGVGPDWIEMEGKVMYEIAALLAYVEQNRRAGSARLKG